MAGHFAYCTGVKVSITENGVGPVSACRIAATGAHFIQCS
jgi:hypothetical protein